MVALIREYGGKKEENPGKNWLVGWSGEKWEDFEIAVRYTDYGMQADGEAVNDQKVLGIQRAVAF